jgi:hypothetical protein
MRQHLLRLVVFSFCLQSVCAFADDDLILPPSLRASPPVADKLEMAPKRAKQKRQKTSAATAPQASLPAVPAEQKAPKHESENPLSFGMKWNANNDPNYGSATTSGLINETNKNLNSQPVGSGGQVGMQYKF